MNKILLLVISTVLLLAGCDTANQGQSTSGVVSEGVTFSQAKVKTNPLPVYQAMENAIRITWYSVPGAVDYELFWADEVNESSITTELTTYQLTTDGFQTYQVWVAALDASGNVISVTSKVTVSSLDVEESVIFSDVAPQ
jgi:uncharacterized protein YcfL